MSYGFKGILNLKATMSAISEGSNFILYKRGLLNGRVEAGILILSSD